MIALRLFGGASIESDGTAVTGPAAQRHRIALLALLAASHPRALTREKLMACLWPERDAEHARKLLNQSVHVLRKAFGDATILSSGDELRLSHDALHCNVVAFDKRSQRAIASVRSSCTRPVPRRLLPERCTRVRALGGRGTGAVPPGASSGAERAGRRARIAGRPRQRRGAVASRSRGRSVRRAVHAALDAGTREVRRPRRSPAPVDNTPFSWSRTSMPGRIPRSSRSPRLRAAAPLAAQVVARPDPRRARRVRAAARPPTPEIDRPRRRGARHVAGNGSSSSYGGSHHAGVRVRLVDLQSITGAHPTNRRASAGEPNGRSGAGLFRGWHARRLDRGAGEDEALAVYSRQSVFAIRGAISRSRRSRASSALMHSWRARSSRAATACASPPRSCERGRRSTSGLQRTRGLSTRRCRSGSGRARHCPGHTDARRRRCPWTNGSPSCREPRGPAGVPDGPVPPSSARRMPTSHPKPARRKSRDRDPVSRGGGSNRFHVGGRLWKAGARLPLASDSTAEPSAAVELYAKSKAAAERALALDETEPQAHASLGFVLFYFEWAWGPAAREIRRAMELDPNSHHWIYALYLQAAGRHDEAIEHFRLAVERNPLSEVLSAQVADAYACAGDHDEALAHARALLTRVERSGRSGAIRDRSVWLLDFESRELSMKGSHDEAIHAAERLVALSRDTASALARLAFAQRWAVVATGRRRCWSDCRDSRW